MIGWNIVLGVSRNKLDVERSVGRDGRANCLPIGVEVGPRLRCGVNDFPALEPRLESHVNAQVQMLADVHQRRLRAVDCALTVLAFAAARNSVSGWLNRGQQRLPVVRDQEQVVFCSVIVDVTSTPRI